VLVGSLAFALAAGAFSSLSPCVLPILPLVLGAAVAEHRWGPAALASGLALSFTVVGLFIATLGFSIGLDAGVFKAIGAVVLIGFGLVLMVPSLSGRLAVAGAGFSGWASEMTSSYSAQGFGGQFILGVLLGAIWSPCVGPTLGAASMLAAQGQDLVQVSATMLMFAGVCMLNLGFGMPMLLDNMDDEVDRRYAALPERLYVLDKDGVIVYRGVMGSRGFDVESWREAVEKQAATIGPA